MNKRNLYPQNEELAAKKILLSLNFVDVSPPAIAKSRSSEEVKAAKAQHTQRITEKLVEALTNMYTMTYKGWIETYWYAALSPNLLLSIDSRQREHALKSFMKSAQAECDSIALVLSKMAEQARPTPLALIEAFLLHARNFEMRTVKRLQAVKSLDTSFHSDEYKSASSWALSIFLATFDPTRESAGSKVFSAITQDLESALHQGFSFDNKTHCSLGKILQYPAALVKTMRRFGGKDQYQGLDPIAITDECLLSEIAANCLYFDTTIPQELHELTFSDLETNADMRQYVETSVVQRAHEWLEQVSVWTGFGIEAHRVFRNLDGTISTTNIGASTGTATTIATGRIDFQTQVSSRLCDQIDSHLEDLPALLCIYATYNIVTPSASVRPSHTYKLPLSEQSVKSIVEKLHTMVMKDEQQTVATASLKLLRLSKIVNEFRHIASEQDYQKLLKHFQQEISHSNIYSDLYHDLISGTLQITEAEELVRLLEIAPGMSGYAILTEDLRDWEEEQYNALVEDIAVHLLPTEIGGRALDIEKARKAHETVAKVLGIPLGVLPKLLMEEARNFKSAGNAILLRWSNWLNTEDPSVSDTLPPILESGLQNSSIGRVIDEKYWALRWHLGWSTLKCKFQANNAQQITFTCSLPQYYIISQLVKSPKALPSTEIHIDGITDEDYINEVLTDLVEKSDGFVVSSQDSEGNTVYAIDSSVVPPSVIARLRFSDKL